VIKIKEVKEIIDLFENYSAVEMEVETDKIKLRVKKDSSRSAFKRPPRLLPLAHVQTSKLVGTFRGTLVKINDTVKKNQPIANIEVLKTINEVVAEAEGTLTEILIKDGQPVEYGEELFIIQLSS